MADIDDAPEGEWPAEGEPKKPADYELTQKDAGWRSPTLFVSRAKIVYFDPPRPKRPRNP